jgi:outer membrane protein, heavy metal efflux system
VVDNSGRNPPIDFYGRRGRQHFLAHLRPQPGREAAHAARYHRNEKLRDAAEAQVFSDVDSAYATLNSNVILLQPYKAKYLQQAVRVRDTVFVFLPARRRVAARFSECAKRLPHRATQLREPGGSYLTAAAQLNMAVGREVSNEK